MFNLVKCVFSLNHANSVPERGFLINKCIENHVARDKLDQIELEILKFKTNLKAANELIKDTNNKQLEESSTKNKHLDRNKIQCAQSKIEIGIQRKGKLESDLEDLKFKQNKPLKYVSKGK